MNNPFDPATLFVDPDSSATRYNASHPGTPEIAFLAAQPQAIWLTDTASTPVRLRNALTQLPGTETAVFVVYNIPGRDNNGASAGGAATLEEYEQFIDTIESLTAPFAPVFILEPDALPFIPQLEDDAAQLRGACLAYAIDQLSEAGTVYVDAGHAAWLSAAETASLYKALGTKANRGFSLNVSNFRTDAECQAYALQLFKATGKPSVIDTSRNGNGPPQNVQETQNPIGRKIGQLPLSMAASQSVDANLWIKCPGESDGPADAGAFVPSLAIELVRG